MRKSLRLLALSVPLAADGIAPYAAYHTVVFVLDSEGRVATYRLEDEKPYRPEETLPGAWRP